jgi:hypothetical protein
VRRGPPVLLPVEGPPAHQPVGTTGALGGVTGSESVGGGAAEAVPTAPDRPGDEPVLVLRSADAAWSAAAMMALLVGLGLLLRPRRPPSGPATPLAAGRRDDGMHAAPEPAVVPVLIDLTSERHRRRSGVAAVDSRSAGPA